MRIEKLFNDHGIQFMTEHKNVRDGWIGFDCPFCGTTETQGKCHMGYSLDDDYFSCWMCGGHSKKRVIARLLRISTTAAEDVIKKYGGKVKGTNEVRVKVGTNKLQLPKDMIDPYSKRPLSYLRNRGFVEPKEIVKTWDLRCTGPSSKLDDLNYSNRILAPIYWENRMVGFQARDMTNRHMAKYMACPPEREVISHKHIIYMNPAAARFDRIILVEGIVDAWKLGIHAGATFGIKYTPEQVQAIASIFKEAVILFDPDKWAQWKARTLKRDLEGKKLKVWQEQMECDPGDLSLEEAKNFVETVMNY